MAKLPAIRQLLEPLSALPPSFLGDGPSFILDSVSMTAEWLLYDFLPPFSPTSETPTHGVRSLRGPACRLRRAVDGLPSGQNGPFIQGIVIDQRHIGGEGPGREIEELFTVGIIKPVQPVGAVDTQHVEGHALGGFRPKLREAGLDVFGPFAGLDVEMQVVGAGDKGIIGLFGGDQALREGGAWIGDTGTPPGGPYVPRCRNRDSG